MTLLLLFLLPLGAIAVYGIFADRIEARLRRNLDRQIARQNHPTASNVTPLKRRQPSA